MWSWRAHHQRARARGSALADLYGATRVPILCSTSSGPLVPEEVWAFCAGKRAVLVVEEGSPDYIEQQINAELRRADLNTHVRQGCCRRPANTSRKSCSRASAFSTQTGPRRLSLLAAPQKLVAHRPAAAQWSAMSPRRRPSAPAAERPVFTAIKLMQRELKLYSTSAPTSAAMLATLRRSAGHSILGYGMPLRERRGHGQPRSPPDCGDGRRRIWHNGSIIGVASNCSTRATACHRHAERLRLGDRPAIRAVEHGRLARRAARHGYRAHAALAGVTWLRKRTPTACHQSRRQGGDARGRRGLKVIIADGECQLARGAWVRAGRRQAQAWPARGERATASTTRSAPAIIPASGSGCPRSRSSPIPTSAERRSRP